MQEIYSTPGIGDPTLLGWFTVIAYFFSSWLCLKAFISEKSGPPRLYLDSILALLRVTKKHWPRVPLHAKRASLWLGLALILILLGINKQLDVQSLITDLGRALAREQGWYNERRSLQVGFIRGLIGITAFIMLALWYLTRGSLKDFRISLLGLAFLACFILIRASSFHGMDHFIGTAILGVPFNNILELSGIGISALGAFLQIKKT